MNQASTTNGAGIAICALKVVMAAVVGALVHGGEYGAAAFVACLFVDAAMPSK